MSLPAGRLPGLPSPSQDLVIHSPCTVCFSLVTQITGLIMCWWDYSFEVSPFSRGYGGQNRLVQNRAWHVEMPINLCSMNGCVGGRTNGC